MTSCSSPHRPSSKCRLTLLVRLLSYGEKYAWRRQPKSHFLLRIGSFVLPVSFYLHGLAVHGVHYLHRPGLILQDAVFFLLPWTFHPFVFQSKKIYTVLIWCRVFAYLVVCQFLRIITFYSTQLPGPNYHCREGSELARLPPPKSALEVLLLNFPEGVMYGCGDLIFSSHMIFTLVFVRTFQKYGTRRFIKQFAWFVAIVQSLLIIASCKHYTVDVVVAWYSVNLVVSLVDQKLPELPDRSMGSTSPPLLQMSTEDRDSRNREELDKFCLGSSSDITT